MIPSRYTEHREGTIVAEAQDFESAAVMTDYQLLDEAQYLSSWFADLMDRSYLVSRRTAAFETMRRLAAVICEIQYRGIDD